MFGVLYTRRSAPCVGSGLCVSSIAQWRLWLSTTLRRTGPVEVASSYS